MSRRWFAGLGAGLCLSLGALAQEAPAGTTPQDGNAAGTLLERAAPGAAGGDDAAAAAEQRSVT